MGKKYKCPICGKYDFKYEYDECPVCGWMLDFYQEKCPDELMTNTYSLNEAKWLWQNGYTLEPKLPENYKDLAEQEKRKVYKEALSEHMKVIYPLLVELEKK